MKKILAGLAIMAITVTAAAAAYQLAFYPQYWVGGAAQDASDGTKVDGRRVVFFRTEEEARSGALSESTVGPGGAAGQPGQFLVSAYSLTLSELAVGGSYYLAIPNDNPGNPATGYGANPVAVKISGTGLDYTTSPLVLALGAGPVFGVPAAPTAPEKPPAVKLWFGSRLYQPALMREGRKFVVTDQPELKVELTISSPYTIASEVESHTIVIDAGTAGAKTLKLGADSIASRTYAAETRPEEGKLSALTLQYTFAEPLAAGEHTVSVTTRSSGRLGTAAAATQVATIEVMGGPLRLIGIPLCYPSPFSITRQGKVTIQYELSANGNIEIYLTSSGGRRVKRLDFSAGTEGGAAGLNKVTWDGMTDQGYKAGNAIYAGTIVARDEGKLLGKFQLTIMD